MVTLKEMSDAKCDIVLPKWLKTEEEKQQRYIFVHKEKERMEREYYDNYDYYNNPSRSE